MSNAQMWSGLAQGIAAIPQGMQEAGLRHTQLESAKSQQKLAAMQLAEYGANAPVREKETEVKLQRLQMESQANNAQSTKKITFDAFDRFSADKDVRHLNTFLADVKKNAVGNKLYGDVVRMDRLTKSTETDAMLRQLGYTDLDAVYNDPDLSKDLVVVTGTDKRGIANINDMYASTGYTKYLDNNKLKDLERKARINQMLRSGQSGSKVALQERVVQDLINSGKAETLAEAYQMLQEINASGRGAGVMSSTEERSVKQIMEDKNVPYLEALDMYYSTKRQGGGGTNESNFVDSYLQEHPEATRTEASGAYRNLTKTSTQKELVDVNTIRKGLDKMDWLDKDVKKMTSNERARVYRDYIGPLEDLRKFKIGNEEKRIIRNMRDLTALGGTVGEQLTPDETGIMDNLLNKFKTYTVDNIGGKEATTAYHTFSNLLRNALYGASLTKPEIAAFNKSAGNLGQKFVPVLTAFKTQVGRLKSQLESIRDLNDPDIAHYYLGMPIEDVDNVIEKLEQRLSDPRLRLSRGATPPQSLRVRQAQSTVTPTVPDVNGTQKNPEFNFDDAMKKAGL